MAMLSRPQSPREEVRRPVPSAPRVAPRVGHERGKSMLRHLRAACAALAIAVSGLAAPASAAAAATPQASLAACHTLTARTATNRLVNGEFELGVFPDFVGIDQTVWLSGSRGRSTYSTGTWFRDDPTGLHQSNTDATRLAFSCKGDLALRTSRNVLLWHTGTANRGATRLSLTSDGNLVMTTGSGHVVWQSRSGRQLMPANSIVPSNARLTNAWADQQGYPIETLTMQADGNLVYREGPTVKWQSHTHVAGSHLALTTSADLRVVTPAGTVVWRSRTRGSSYSALLLPKLWQVVPDTRRLWKVPHSF